MIKSFVITLVTVVNSSEIVKKVKFYSLTGFGGLSSRSDKIKGGRAGRHPVKCRKGNKKQNEILFTY